MTQSVGLALSVAGQGADTFAANLYAIRLLDDTRLLGDAHQLSLLPGAFEELHEIELRHKTGEAAFVLLGLLLARIQLGVDVAEASRLAEQIMAEEAGSFNGSSTEFLWGTTHFDMLQKLWRQNVSRILTPATPNLQLLREALLAE